MGRIKKLDLNSSQIMELEEGFRHGKSHCYRMRCRGVLLKAQGLPSKNAGEQTEMSLVSINKWIKRFLSDGIKGLETRSGRGRKSIINNSDTESVKAAVKDDRQSVSRAKEAWQKATGKEASEKTFKRFLAALAQDISV